MSNARIEQIIAGLNKFQNLPPKEKQRILEEEKSQPNTIESLRSVMTPAELRRLARNLHRTPYSNTMANTSIPRNNITNKQRNAYNKSIGAKHTRKHFQPYLRNKAEGNLLRAIENTKRAKKLYYNSVGNRTTVPTAFHKAARNKNKTNKQNAYVKALQKQKNLEEALAMHN
jgi:hypothetical protein